MWITRNGTVKIQEPGQKIKIMGGVMGIMEIHKNHRIKLMTRT